jgi:hypothetical protein
VRIVACAVLAPRLPILRCWRRGGADVGGFSVTPGSGGQGGDRATRNAHGADVQLLPQRHHSSVAQLHRRRPGGLRGDSQPAIATDTGSEAPVARATPQPERHA